MDIPHPTFATSVRHYQRGEERRRDTIMIREQTMTEDERKKWLGAKPTPVKAKTWRPVEAKF